MNETLPKTGIIYCRVSSLEQVDGTSLESQEKICKEFAEKENITVLKIFIEKGESAKTTERTEFTKAINFCSDKKNKVNYFVVYKLDRFARNQVDHITVREILKKYGTELKSVTEPISDSPVGKMMESMLSAFAEFDNNVRTERSVNGMKERIKQGIWVWQSPLGYHRTEKGGNIVPDPKFAPYIRTIFEEYSKGTYTFEALANHMNSLGFRTRVGKSAIPQLMEKIIRNPLYCGIIKVWDMEYKGQFEPIISEDLFYECNGGKKKVTSRKAKNPNFPLRKLIICGTCHKPLTGSRATGRHGKKYSYYHHHLQDCPNAQFIPKEHFEQMFLEYLQELSPNFEFEKAFKAIVLDIWKNNFKNIDNQNEKIRKSIKTLEQERQKVFDMHREGIYTDEEFVEQKRIVQIKIKDKMGMLHTSSHKEFNMDEALEYCFNFVRNTAETWKNFENKPESRLRFQNLIFEENIEFLNEEFGNSKLTPIYKLYQTYLTDKSQLVTLQGIEP